MNLIRWTPFTQTSQLQDRMNRLFDTALQNWPSENGTTAWMPASDIYESDNELVVTLDIPGVDPKSIDVRVENSVLSIRGERKPEGQEDRESFHRVERLHGPFARSFTLSTTVDADKIRATYNDGVLRILLPKAEQAEPRKIEIAAARVA